MLSSVGWDWIPEVHDRNMGIWQPVYLRTTGQVTISQPRIITELPNLPDTSLAKLTLELQLTNNAAKPQSRLAAGDHQPRRILRATAIQLSHKT